jgi:hypothetical protein
LLVVFAKRSTGLRFLAWRSLQVVIIQVFSKIGDPLTLLANSVILFSAKARYCPRTSSREFAPALCF